MVFRDHGAMFFGEASKDSGRFHRSMIHVVLVRNLEFARAGYNWEAQVRFWNIYMLSVSSLR